MICLGPVVFVCSVASGLAGATVERADVVITDGVIVAVGNLGYSRLVNCAVCLARDGVGRSVIFFRGSTGLATNYLSCVGARETSAISSTACARSLRVTSQWVTKRIRLLIWLVASPMRASASNRLPA